MTTTSSSDEVLLGVTGSIAAYKACEIASFLVKAGLRVTCAMTASARQLVGPASLEAITGRRVITEMFEPIEAASIEHIALASRVGLAIVAPATANILAKAAHGVADDWLSTTLLATRAPVLFAPAMNTMMYTHPATQDNIALLTARGCRFVGPASGRLACGSEGPGRMEEPALIAEAALILLSEQDDLAGKSVLITSGGTREPIDPVRYIGNRSSGKQGRALAFEALRRKAEVTVITGPGSVPMPWGAQVIQVETALEMHARALELAPQSDIIIGAAAVGDYRVAEFSPGKRKRGGAPLKLEMIENPDIIAGVCAARRPGQVIIGFAAETSAPEVFGAEKLRRKGLDILLANDVSRTDAGFGAEQLEAWLITAHEQPEQLGFITKRDVARLLMDKASVLLGVG